MDMTSAPTIRIQRRFFDLDDKMLADFDRLSLWRAFGASASCDWDELLKSPRVLLISEAGSGKTHECKAEQERLWDAGEAAFYLELAELAKGELDALLTPDEATRLEAWRTAQSELATFFLDSFDELQLTRGSFRTALNRLTKAIGGQLHRVRVVVTARPIAFDQSLIRERLPVPLQPEPAASPEAFADLAMGRRRDTAVTTESKPPPDWRTAALMPLDDAQMRHFAQEQAVPDADAMLAAIRHDNAEDFAHRPQDLIELCASWRDHGRIGSHREQVESNISVKLKPRTDRDERTALAPDKAREGAARLALAALLTRKLTLRHSVEADQDGEPGTALDPQTILSDWDDGERKTLLERPLFSFASYGRVRFHHRSVIEFLAAERLHSLRQRGMSIRAIQRLLFAELAYGPRVVKPTMRPVAAWLVLRDGTDSIFDEVLAREPEVLLDHGDPRSLSIERRLRVLRTYVERYGSGGSRGQRIPSLQVRRFATPHLSDEVLRLWAPGIDNPDVRKLLLDVAAAAPIPAMTDIAHHVLFDETAALGERLSALDVLVRMDDARLDDFTQALADEPGRWPKRLVQSALLDLTPKHITADRLCDVLGKWDNSIAEQDDLGDLLSAMLERHVVPTEYLDAIRDRLTSSLMTIILWFRDDYEFVSSRHHLVAPLAVVCERLFETGHVSPGVVRSSIVATRLVRLGIMDNVHSDTLCNALMNSSLGVRARVFWADDAFLQSFAPEADSQRRLIRVTSQEGMIRLHPKTDAPWVLAALVDRQRPEDQRALMLEAALRGIFDGPDDWAQRAESLRPYVADSPALLERIASALIPPAADAEHERQRVTWEQKRHEREHEEERKHAAWRDFWTEVARSPDAAFSADRQDNTIRDLWSVMRRTGKHSHASGWNRRFMEQNFGRETTERMREALTRAWRQHHPTLRSERLAGEKNTNLARWALGVAAIAAEAEHPHWARNLSAEEAERAARFALMELNGLPSWLDSLAAAHPDTVAGVLGAELIRELDELAAKGGYDALLQHLRRASPELASMFLRRLRQWLDANADRMCDGDDIERAMDRLYAVVEVLLTFGDEDLRLHVLNLARTALDSGCRSEFEAIWLPILMRLQPEDGVGRLERMLLPAEPQTLGIGATWIARLFGDRHNEVLVDPRGPDFTPALLLRLVHIAYRHVRQCEDNRREREGAYRPGPRDHAQHGRSALLNALLDRTGAGAWAAKLDLAGDLEHADFRDRLLTLARDKAAEEADGATLSVQEAAAFDRTYEAPPATRDDLFGLLRDRLDDLEEMLKGDASPRGSWSVDKDERVMRKSIAHELEMMSNGLYSVPQESVTADENRTDIRLSVAGHDLEAVIELKIGERWSGRELRDTLNDQLVTKYMAPENRRAGCLLVTVAQQRSWHHPDTDAPLDVAGLRAMLEAEVEKIVTQMGGQLRLMARILDLRPPP
jgi:hypothetical protein